MKATIAELVGRWQWARIGGLAMRMARFESSAYSVMVLGLGREGQPEAHGERDTWGESRW